MRNRRLLSVDIAPVRVNPFRREAQVAENLEVDIAFDTASPASTRKTPPEERLPEGFVAGQPGRYMILMDDQFTNNAALTAFMDWKTRKGYDVSILKTSEIDPGGAPTNGQILAHLRALPADQYPEYLLIIGGHTATQGVEGTYFSTSAGGWSDHYLACRTSTDLYPDLYCGRLFATNDLTLTRMLDKAMSMDRSPPGGDFYRRAIVAGQIQDREDDYTNEADRLFCETADALACYFEQHAGGVDYTCRRAVVNPNNVNEHCLWNRDSILWNFGDEIGSRIFTNFVSVAAARARVSSNINEGVGIVQHRDHGSNSGWGDPYYYASDVRARTNGVQRPVVFSINCLTAAYQNYNNFARAWLEHTNGGAYAVFGAVDVSYSWHNDWLNYGFYTAFLTNFVTWQNACATPNWPQDLPSAGGAYGADGSARRLGEILNFGKMYYREHYGWNPTTTFRLFHLFGDPEAFIQIDTPQTQVVAHTEEVAAGPATIAVTTGEEGSQICLFNEDLGIHAVTTTPASGTATLSISTLNTGMVRVTVTRFGRAPYEGLVEVSGSVIAMRGAEAKAAEDAGEAIVTVVRNGDTQTVVHVDYETSDGSALGGSDYGAAGGTLEFAEGEISKDIHIPVIDEGDDESSEFFTVRLFNVVSAGDALLGVPSTTTVSIADNDGAGELSLLTDSLTVGEGGTALCAVIRRNGAEGDAAVEYSTVPGSASADQDYTATNGVLSFAAGVTTQILEVSILDDFSEESIESFSIALSNPGAGTTLVSPTSAVIHIADEDEAGLAFLPATSYAVIETNAVLEVAVQRTGGDDGDVSVEYVTRNGSAKGGLDYAAVTGTLALAHGVTGGVFSISLIDDASVETQESFSVSLRNPSGGLAMGSATSASIAVVSEDGAILAAFCDGDPGWAREGQWQFGVPAGMGGYYSSGQGPPDPKSGFTGNKVLGYNLQGNYSANIGTVYYLTTPAMDGSLYTNLELRFQRWLGVEKAPNDRAWIELSRDGINWQVVWSNGSVNAMTDSAWRAVSCNLSAWADEQESVYLRWGMGRTDISMQYCGWNLDDIMVMGTPISIPEGVCRFAIAPVDGLLSETGGTVTLRVCRRGDPNMDATVDYQTVSGSATAGLDFVAASGTLLFPSGIVERTVEIEILDDSICETTEVAGVQLSNPSANATLGVCAQVWLSIADNEIFAASLPFFEGFESGVFSNYWTRYSTYNGRIFITNGISPFAGSRHAILDANPSAGYYSLNELELALDLAGRQNVTISFYHKDIADDDNLLPASFAGHVSGDGVAISADGVQWHKARGLLTADGVSNQYRQFVVDLDACAASNGLSYTSTFRIRFQQYDNLTISSDGFAFDNIQVAGSSNATPAAYIVTPFHNAEFVQGETVEFSGYGADPEEGPLTNLAWNSSLGGFLGSGTSLVCAALGSGAHTVSVCVVDACAATGRASIAIQVWEDADGNGLPDSWEAGYWTGEKPGAHVDSDGDGFNDNEEWLAGSNPTNSQSGFELAAPWVLTAPGGVQLQWQGIPCRLYTIEQCADLRDGFQPLATAGYFAAAGGCCITDCPPADTSIRFYRIEVGR